MRPSRVPWVDNVYPLVDARLTRRDCERICEEYLGKIPQKSSCVYCPYHSDGFWRNLKHDYPEEFERAAKFDEAIRDMSMAGIKRPIFIHRTLRPLREVDFGENQRDLFAEECAGVCGV